jgi:uncharacterized protein YceK
MRHLKLLLLVAVFALAVPIMPGCSSQHTETTTTRTYPDNASSTTTTTTSDDDHDSLLGATGHFVWTVIAFPFRVVGDVIGEIV